MQANQKNKKCPLWFTLFAGVVVLGVYTRTRDAAPPRPSPTDQDLIETSQNISNNAYETTDESLVLIYSQLNNVNEYIAKGQATVLDDNGFNTPIHSLISLAPELAINSAVSDPLHRLQPYTDQAQSKGFSTPLITEKNKLLSRWVQTMMACAELYEQKGMWFETSETYRSIFNMTLAGSKERTTAFKDYFAWAQRCWQQAQSTNTDGNAEKAGRLKSWAHIASGYIADNIVSGDPKDIQDQAANLWLTVMEDRTINDPTKGLGRNPQFFYKGTPTPEQSKRFEKILARTTPPPSLNQQRKR